MRSVWELQREEACFMMDLTAKRLFEKVSSTDDEGATGENLKELTG